MAKAIRNLAYRHGTYNVFADFCEMAACSFSNAVDKRNYEKREARYMAIVQKYSKEEVNIFPELLGMLSMELEYGPRDVMGELFHELELHNEHAGQYFTPWHLCEMMAQLTYGEDISQIVEQKGYVSAQEPACGSGALILGLASAMLSKKINYQQCLHVSAIDLDSRCVHMAYLQFSLLHIPAVVYCGNTLTLELHDAWYTPAHIMDGWDWRLGRADRPDNPLQELLAVVEKVAQLTEPPVPVVTVPEQTVPAPAAAVKAPKTKAAKQAAMGQLTLF
jgi:hypothetical protein